MSNGPISDLIRRANNDIALWWSAIVVVVYRPIEFGMRHNKASACARVGSFPGGWGGNDFARPKAKNIVVVVAYVEVVFVEEMGAAKDRVKSGEEAARVPVVDSDGGEVLPIVGG